MEEPVLSQIALAGIVFLAMIVPFAIVSIILDHHWSRYEIELDRKRKVRRIYYTGAGIILGSMLVAFISILL